MQKSPRLHLQFSLKNIVLKFEGDRSNGFWDISNEKSADVSSFWGENRQKMGLRQKFFREMKTLSIWNYLKESS